MEVEDEVSVFTRGKLVSWLADYVESRDVEAKARNTKESIGLALKKWLESNPGDVLQDGEHGIEASLQEKDLPGRDADLVALFQRDPDLFRQLLHNGCLKVDEVAIKRAGANVGGINHYLAPKRRGTSLVVRKL